MMGLHPHWRGILSRAWSVRLMLLAGVASAAEVILPFYTDSMPRGLFALLTVFVTPLALVARIVAQRNMDDRP